MYAERATSCLAAFFGGPSGPAPRFAVGFAQTQNAASLILLLVLLQSTKIPTIRQPPLTPTQSILYYSVELVAVSASAIHFGSIVSPQSQKDTRRGKKLKRRWTDREFELNRGEKPLQILNKD